MKGSQREYARHRGVSHVAVGKAVKTGRISLGADGKIDFERADSAWAANTNQIKQASTGGGEKTRKKDAESPRKRSEEKQPSQQSNQAPTASIPAPVDSGGVSMVKAQTMRAVFQAQREKLKFEEESGKKIDSDEVRVKAFARGRAARDKLMSAPARIGPKIVGVTDLVQVITILEDELRAIAQEIADETTASV